jgi:hypothetical protein
MFRTSAAGRIGRALVAITFAVAALSLSSPETAHAKHNNGAAVALGIIGGALAGAAIASGAPPAYAAPPVYYYPYPPPAYVTVPVPAYQYPPPPAAYYDPPPPAAYYGPALYYGSPYYYGAY